MATLYWLQAGACGGDSMSLLNKDAPDLPTLLADLDIELLWHPSLSTLSPGEAAALEERLVSGAQPLDILVLEGAVIRGPDGSGLFDARGGKPKMALIEALCKRARFVIAAGTCAAYGGFGADGVIQATGLQFLKDSPGGFLGTDFRSGSGLPVINLAGCPVHAEVLAGTLEALVLGVPMRLDDAQRPIDWYGVMVHQGCTRNEYHEYRVEEKEFGQKGCLFFHLGCHGPLVPGPCNKHLWNGRSSKPRAGVPCFGCTDPSFPSRHPFFETRNIEGIPLALPKGVSRAHYMVYKGMAAAAAPQRLKEREAEV